MARMIIFDGIVFKQGEGKIDSMWTQNMWVSLMQPDRSRQECVFSQAIYE